MRDYHNPDNEKPLDFELPVFSSGLFVYNTFSQLPLSSIKESSSPWFSILDYGFVIAQVLNCNSLLFFNKSIFFW